MTWNDMDCGNRFLPSVLFSCLLDQCPCLVWLFNRKYIERKSITHSPSPGVSITEVPLRSTSRCTPPLLTVTTQLPIFNERNLVERLIDAVEAFRYPVGKHEIQVLDDSTDETRGRVAEK
jgi:cellulose synthase/poly-beta-1,6-N-acetylglucosamine synthase-like glycosyltransferase